jgi:hypothetical protein
MIRIHGTITKVFLNKHQDASAEEQEHANYFIVSLIDESNNNAANSNAASSNASTSNAPGVLTETRYKCYNPYFSWVVVDDEIFGVGEIIDDKIRERNIAGAIRFVQRPYIRPSTSKKSIVSSFIKATRSIVPNHEILYDLLTEKAISLQRRTNSANNSSYKNNNNINNMSTVIFDYFCHLTESFLMGQHHVIDPLTVKIKPKVIIDICKWWDKNINSRRLYLLGLKDSDIEGAMSIICLTKSELYWKCCTFPWACTSFTRDQVEDISNTICFIPEPEDIRCFEILKNCYNNIKYNQQTSLSVTALHKQCPDIIYYYDRIFSKFGIYCHQNPIINDNTYVESNSNNEPQQETYFYYRPIFDEETFFLNQVMKIRNSAMIDIRSGLFRAENFRFPKPSASKKQLTREQMDACIGAFTNPFSIITGSAGTGKTTITKVILHNFHHLELKCLLCSPTGSAASRQKIATGHDEAYTLDRAISNAYKMEPFDVVIIDEGSMTTKKLINRFFRAFPLERRPYRMIIIGDHQQLPPVEYGSVFEELIRSNKVPVFRLTVNLRVVNSASQGDNSEDNGILYNCWNILHNPNDWSFRTTDNFLLYPGDISVVRHVIQAARENGIDQQHLKVITPFKADTIEINKIYSEIYDDGYDAIQDTQGNSWRVHNQVLLTENNYDIKIFNGEEGIIEDIDPDAHELTVRFYNDQVETFYYDDRSHADSTQDNDKSKSKNSRSKGGKNDKKVKEKIKLPIKLLALSGCLTTHRAQGKEWPYIIFYYPKKEYANGYVPKMCNKKLVYSALTRAQNQVFCIGDIEALEFAAKRDPPRRTDNFNNRLQLVL